MKIWIVILFLGLELYAQAQEVEHEGVKYEVKGDAIFQDGKDVTQTLTIEKQNQIRSALEQRMMLVKTANEAQKNQEQAEKELKKAEKAQKRAEKELKAKQKAQDNFQRASKKLQQNQSKYEKLKRKGKLSPVAEQQWLDRLENYRENVEQAKKKLN